MRRQENCDGGRKAPTYHQSVTGRLDTMSRTAAMRRLGVAWTRLLTLESQGALSPQDDGEHVRYLVAEVEAVRSQLRAEPVRVKRGRLKKLPSEKAAPASVEPIERLERRGRLAAAVFDCFERGLSLAQIVREARVDPYTVRQLWEEYKRPLDAPDKERAEDRKNRELELALRDSRRQERAEQNRAFRERALRVEEEKVALEKMRLAREASATPALRRPFERSS